MAPYEPFALDEHPLDVQALAASLAHSGAGALVSFEGRVRDTDGRREVTGLDYEAYVPLCRAEGSVILRQAARGVIAARCVHRVGRLAVGDVAVWVGVVAAHRDEAFRACRFIIDEVKRRVPIWKKEHYRDGSSGWIGLDEVPGVLTEAPQASAGSAEQKKARGREMPPG